jgi:Asp-tRNA(Asn)/Glu-tRNA(Gln) amidotransferase A subunit family amidase
MTPFQDWYSEHGRLLPHDETVVRAAWNAAIEAAASLDANLADIDLPPERERDYRLAWNEQAKAIQMLRVYENP